MAERTGQTRAASGRSRRYEDKPLLDLVGGIYEAVRQPERWDDFLAAFAKHLRASRMVLFVGDVEAGALGFFRSHNIPDDALERYRAHYMACDVWLDYAAKVRWPVCEAEATHEYYSARDLEASEFYNDHLKKLDVYYGCGGILRYDGPVMSVIHAHRPRRAGPFGPRAKALFDLLLPHIARAVQLHREFAALEEASGAEAAVFDYLSMGILLLDGDGRVIFRNRSVQRIIAADEGFTIDRDGRCRAATPDESTALRRLIHDVVETGEGRGLDPGGAMTLSRPSGRRPYGVLVAPLGRVSFDLVAQRPAAAVFLFDPERKPEAPAALLRRLYGLTAMEAHLAETLMTGIRLKSAAEALGITEGTARGYLKAVFHKTGARRQADLAALLLSGPAGVLDFPHD